MSLAQATDAMLARRTPSDNDESRTTSSDVLQYQKLQSTLLAAIDDTRKQLPQIHGMGIRRGFPSKLHGAIQKYVEFVRSSLGNKFDTAVAAEANTGGGFFALGYIADQNQAELRNLLSETVLGLHMLTRVEEAIKVIDKSIESVCRRETPTNTKQKHQWLKTGLPPDGWHKTPLFGLLKDIERWAGTTDKTLHNKNGVRWWVTPWIGTDDPKAETRYAIYFPTEAQYATANQRRLTPASKNTKPSGENRSKSERTGAVRVKAKRK